MHSIDARQNGLEAAIISMMDYYNGIVADLRGRVADLEKAAKERTLATARREPLKAVSGA